MRFQCTRHFALFNSDLLDLAIRAAHVEDLARLVKLSTVRNCVARVHVHDLLDHPDVPNLDHTI